MSSGSTTRSWRCGKTHGFCVRRAFADCFLCHSADAIRPRATPIARATLDNNSDDTVLGSISAASNASSAVPPPCNDARKNVCLLCRDPDAPCDEITEALINLLMDAMLSQNLLHALDHFCANHKIVPEFTSIPSTGNMPGGTRGWRLVEPLLDHRGWWRHEHVCVHVAFRRYAASNPPVVPKTPSGLSRRGSCRGIPRRNIVTSVRHHKPQLCDLMAI